MGKVAAGRRSSALSLIVDAQVKGVERGLSTSSFSDLFLLLGLWDDVVDVELLGHLREELLLLVVEVHLRHWVQVLVLCWADVAHERRSSTLDYWIAHLLLLEPAIAVALESLWHLKVLDDLTVSLHANLAALKQVLNLLKVLFFIIKLLLLVLAIILRDRATQLRPGPMSIAISITEAMTADLAWNIPARLLACLPLLFVLLSSEQLRRPLLSAPIEECLHLLGVDSGSDGLTDGPLVLVVECVVHLVVVKMGVSGLLQFVGLFLLLVFIVCLRELRVDDCEKQVEQEEGTCEDHNDEENEDEVGEGPLHHGLDVGPALKRNALEHVQQRVLDRIKVCNAVVWICVLLSAKVATRALRHS